MASFTDASFDHTSPSDIDSQAEPHLGVQGSLARLHLVPTETKVTKADKKELRPRRKSIQAAKARRK